MTSPSVPTTQGERDDPYVIDRKVQPHTADQCNFERCEFCGCCWEPDTFRTPDDEIRILR